MDQGDGRQIIWKNDLESWSHLSSNEFKLSAKTYACGAMQ